MKDIKDYLHLYIGSEVQVPDTLPEGSWIITGLVTKQIQFGTILRLQLFNELKENNEGIQWLDYDVCKLILRPLSDMTEEEAFDLIGAKGMYNSCELRITKLGIDVTYQIDAGGEGMYVQGYELQWNAIPPYKLNWFLSKGFDLFGLIEEGLAIENP